MLVAMLAPYADRQGVDAYAAAGIDAFAMEFMPRITRAQSMDALSSQATITGYKGALVAAGRLLAGRARLARVLCSGDGAQRRV
jgi:NAD(P) transhydrogenase subunit alpha